MLMVHGSNYSRSVHSIIVTDKATDIDKASKYSQYQTKIIEGISVEEYTSC